MPESGTYGSVRGGVAGQPASLPRSPTKIPDAGQFKRISKGDQVEATHAEAIAIAVTPAAKK